MWRSVSWSPVIPFPLQDRSRKGLAMLRALVNVIGPSGELIEAGSPIPAEWPQEFQDALESSGGAEQDDDGGGE